MAVSILRLPLWPLALTFNVAGSSSLGAGPLLALALESCYLVVRARLGAVFLERRDLLFP